MTTTCITKKEASIEEIANTLMDDNIAAVLILGAKVVLDDERKQNKPRHWYSFKRKKPVSLCAELAQKILENVRPSVLFNCIIQRLKDNEVGFFFLIITSLSEANLLKPTKEIKA